MLETIVTLPVIFIMLLAVVEFGLISANLKTVQAASRAGAKVASEVSTGTLPTAVSTVATKVSNVLSAAGIDSCQVILEHNATACVAGGTRQDSGSCSKCGPPSASLPLLATITGGSVRVTVCVNVSELTPDLLSSFGFSIANQAVNVSTTFPYENCNP